MRSRDKFTAAVVSLFCCFDEKVRFTSKDKADYAILLIRQGFFDEEMWGYFLTADPVFSVKESNTLLVGIYKTKKSR